MCFFLSNLYKIEVMKTSPIEMLELQNFGQVTTPTITFEVDHKIPLVTSWAELTTSNYSLF